MNLARDKDAYDFRGFTYMRRKNPMDQSLKLANISSPVSLLTLSPDPVSCLGKSSMERASDMPENGVFGFPSALLSPELRKQKKSTVFRSPL